MTDLYKKFEKEIATFEAATEETFDGDFKKLADWFELEGTKAAAMESVKKLEIVSAFGVLSSPSLKYFNLANATAVTAAGRAAIIYNSTKLIERLDAARSSLTGNETLEQIVEKIKQVY